MYRCFCKSTITLLLFLNGISISTVDAQVLDNSKKSLGDYLYRQYLVEHADGCRIVENLSEKYVVSIVTLMPANYVNNPQNINIVAPTKARRQIMQYKSGTTIEYLTIVENDVLTKDVIIETSINYAPSSIELLKSFDYNESEKVYIYILKINKL